MPYFSVITPSFNQGAYIEDCIRSVIEQGTNDFEHLIYDNCSTDETASVVARYPHVACVSEADRGQSHAVNKGFQAARGEIICWLNADDAYTPSVFATLKQLFADPAVHVVYGDVEQIGYDGNDSVISKGRFGSRLDLIRWWSPDVKLHQPAIFFRRSVIERIGLLREDLHYAMDYEYWWRMSEHYMFHYVPKVLAIQHRQPESKTVMAWDRVLRERERSFSPFYSLLPGRTAAQLEIEKRTFLSRLYLTRAYIAAANSPKHALHFLRLAIQQRPAILLSREPLGVIRNLLKRGQGRPVHVVVAPTTFNPKGRDG